MSRIKALADLKTEFKRISWMTKEDLLSQTKVVLLSILLVGVLVYAADLVVRNTLVLISNALKFIIR